MISFRILQRWCGYNERSTQTSTQCKTSFSLIQNELMFPPLKVSPLPHCNNRRHKKLVVFKCFFNITHLATASHIIPYIIEPKLYSIVSGFSNQSDFIHQTLWFNCASIKAINHNLLGSYLICKLSSIYFERQGNIQSAIQIFDFQYNIPRHPEGYRLRKVLLGSVRQFWHPGKF